MLRPVGKVSELPVGWKWVRGGQMFRVLLELEMFWAPKSGLFRRLIPRAGRRCMTRSDGERKAWRGMIHETARRWTKVHRMPRGSSRVIYNSLGKV